MFGRKRKIQEMQSLINASRKDLEIAENEAKGLSKQLQLANKKIEERNKIIERQDKKIQRMQNKIDDLMNNVEFLYNNLSSKKKALVRPANQN